MAVLPCGWCGAPDLHAIGKVGDIGDPKRIFPAKVMIPL